MRNAANFFGGIAVECIPFDHISGADRCLSIDEKRTVEILHLNILSMSKWIYRPDDHFLNQKFGVYSYHTAPMVLSVLWINPYFLLFIVLTHISIKPSLASESGKPRMALAALSA